MRARRGREGEVGRERGRREGRKTRKRKEGQLLSLVLPKELDVPNHPSILPTTSYTSMLYTIP